MKLFLCGTELHFRIKSFFTVEQWRLQIQMLRTTRHVSCRYRLLYHNMFQVALLFIVVKFVLKHMNGRL